MDTGSSHCDDVDNSRTSSVDTHSSSQKCVVATPGVTLRHKQCHSAQQLHDSSNSSSSGGVRGVVMRERVHSACVEATQSRDAAAARAAYRLSTPEVSARHASSSVVTSRTHPTPSHLNIGTAVTADTHSHHKSQPAAGAQTRTKNESKQSSQSSSSASSNYLTVPSYHSAKERASNSSLSSGYYGSSRSGTTIPTTPEVNSKWYLDNTPPGSPPPGRARAKQSAAELGKEFSPPPFQRTSSLHRPLGFAPIINVSSSSPAHSAAYWRGGDDPQRLKSASLPQWQVEQWRHWEQVAKQRGDDSHEQETLV